MTAVEWEAIGAWPVRVLIAGGLVLLAGRIVVSLFRQPARRAWVGTATVIAALLAIPVGVLPGWLRITVPQRQTATAVPVAVAEPTAPPVAPAADVTLARRAALAELLARNWQQMAAQPAELPPHEGAAPVAPTPPPATPARAIELPQPSEVTTTPFPWLAVAAGTYAMIAGLLIVRLLVGHFVLARLWRRARPAPAWAEAVFRRLADRACPAARLRVSARPVGPVCFGILRPRVLVPASLLVAGDGPGLRAVFAHELAHLNRHDPLAGWLHGLGRAAYFVFPWVAGLRREVRVAQECLADAAAAHQAAGPAEYAELLIRMARSRPAPLGAAGARGPSSELYRRVTMLLRSPDSERRCPRRWALAVGGGLTALAVLAAGLSVQPRPATAAEPEKVEPAKKEADRKDVKKDDAKKDVRKETKDEAKKDEKADPFKDVLDKLRKDLKDDPETLKRVEDMIKDAQKGIPPAVDPGKGPPPLPFNPPAIPLLPGVDADKELEMMQKMLQQQLEMMQKQLQAGGGFRVGGGFAGPGAPRLWTPVGPASRARLGIHVQPPSDVLSSQLDLPPGQGLVCADVPANSVAGKAGVKPHDILLEVGGKAVSSNMLEFQKLLKDVKPDTPVDVVVMRKGKKETIKGVKLPEAKAPEMPDFPGLPDFQPLFPPQPPGAARVPAPGGDIPIGPGETARVEQVNDAFTVFYAKNGVKVTIAGTKDGGTPKAESIEVDDNGKTTRAESIDKLPKEYQDLAKNALKAVK
jgi:beta-lactamase regulating signal transducer with metallopeptidase domain